MGAAQSTSESNHFSFPLSLKHAESKPRSLFIEEYRNFQSASPEQRQYLISLIIPCFRRSFKNDEDLDMTIQEYFYYPDSISTTLFLFRSKVNQEVRGFTISLLTEVYLLPNNKTNENRFIVSSRIGCLDRSERRSGVAKHQYVYEQLSHVENFPNSNLVHFEVSTQPMPYYHACSLNTIYPRYCYDTPVRIMELINIMVEKINYERYDEENPFLVKDTLETIDDFREMFRKDIEKMPEDLKFYYRKTGLRKNIGLIFVVIWRLLDGNSLGLAGGSHLKVKDHNFEVRSVDFRKNNFKI